MTKVSEGSVRLTASDGHELDAFSARPDGESRGGLVILQEIFGVTDQLKGIARRYAAEGFTTLVPALFDRQAPGTVVPFDEGGRGRELMDGSDPAEALLDIDAAARHAGGAKGASVMGFCWGGGLALRAAIGLDLKGAVAFYGTRLDTILGPSVRCPMQFHFGATDTHTPPETVAAVREKAPGAEVHIYEAGHAFANDARPAVYVADAAKLAHERALEFLKRVHPA
jgi:carboxymethylenebutenolidase